MPLGRLECAHFVSRGLVASKKWPTTVGDPCINKAVERKGALISLLVANLGMIGTFPVLLVYLPFLSKLCFHSLDFLLPLLCSVNSKLRLPSSRCLHLLSCGPIAPFSSVPRSFSSDTNVYMHKYSVLWSHCFIYLSASFIPVRHHGLHAQILECIFLPSETKPMPSTCNVPIYFFAEEDEARPNAVQNNPHSVDFGCIFPGVLMSAATVLRILGGV